MERSLFTVDCVRSGCFGFGRRAKSEVVMLAGRLRVKRGLFRLTVVWTILSGVIGVVYVGCRCHADRKHWEECVTALIMSKDEIRAPIPWPDWARELFFPAGLFHDYDDVNKVSYDRIVRHAAELVTVWVNIQPEARFRTEQQNWLLENNCRPCIEKAIALWGADTPFARATLSDESLLPLLWPAGLYGATIGAVSLWTAIALVWIPYRTVRWIVCGFLHSEPDVKGNIEQSGDRFSGETVVSEEASTPREEQTKQELPVNWLNFYIYIWIPLGIAISVIYCGIAVLAAYQGNHPVPMGHLRATAGGLCLAVPLFIGLHRRCLWAWRLNWFVLVLGTLFTPLDKADNVTMYLVFLMAVTLLWFLPNAIYFKKRRCLFT